MAGKQSQANKNFWYAYALWQQKVAQALARRRAEALARKRAEAEARARQAQQPTPPKSSSPLAKLVKMGLFLIALGGVGLSGGSVQVVESPMSVATEMVNELSDTPDNSQDLEYCGAFAMFCPYGNGSGGGGSGLIIPIRPEDVILLLAALLGISNASADVQALPQPQIGPMPYNPDEEYLDEIPLDRILRIPWADFMNPDLDEPDGCNSEEFAIWWYSLPPAPAGNGLPEDRAYEDRVARGLGTMGTTQNVPAGLETINADGANPDNCFLIEAKHARNPENPSWQDDGFYMILNFVDDEIRRYYLSMASNPQVWGLEIRTNSEVAKEYFESRLRHYGFLVGVNGIVVIYP